jgi:glycerol-1-phosphate dehydrogenase [NAD(P)+]
VKPSADVAREIAAHLRDTGCSPVAVGSGVVNDLVKYATALAERPYVCVPTAASMDGYAASGAALVEGRFKQTMPCPPPAAIVADLDVLATAPARMASWGYGDLAGKLVAGADWILADALGVDAIHAGPFAMVQDHLAEWLAGPERLAARDPEALGNLLTGLLVTGFAMQAHGNSRPASGSDHQFSHLWEMESLTIEGEPAAHGACVGVGCVAMLALYEWLCAQTIEEPEIDRAVALAADADSQKRKADALESEIDRAFADPLIATNARAEMGAKRSAGDCGARLSRLALEWPALRERFARLPRAADVQRDLRAAGGVAHPADLGIPLATLAADYRRARLIRRRYTVLDLVEDLGWLERAIEALFAADGFWGRQSASASTRSFAESSMH